MSDAPERKPDPGDIPSIRASDAERETIIDRLSEHASAGRLTPEELDERIGRAYQARTRGDLAQLLDDLPEQTPSPASTPSGRPATKVQFAIMGGSEKKGRWRVAPRMTSVAIMGGNTIDLRHAELDSNDTTIVVVAVMGGTDVYVPDGIDLEVGGFAVMGGNGERGSTRPARPGAPRIKLRIYSLMGGCDVWRIPEEARDVPLRDARKIAKRAA